MFELVLTSTQILFLGCSPSRFLLSTWSGVGNCVSVLHDIG